MAGEEFDAQYVPLPKLSPHLFGGADPGQGTWLYGSMLQWDRLGDARHRGMLEDVKRLIAIRKREAPILAARPTYAQKNIAAPSFSPDFDCPPPYLRWDDSAAILVAGNLSDMQDVHLTVSIPLAEVGLAGHATYTVTDLWTGDTLQHSEHDIEHFSCTIPRDKDHGGGLRSSRSSPANGRLCRHVCASAQDFGKCRSWDCFARVWSRRR